MTAPITREIGATPKGSALTNAEIDQNFLNLTAEKEPTIAVGASTQMWLGNKTWASVLSQVQGTLLTGLSLVTGTAVTAADNILSAIGKLQAQVSARLPLGGGTMVGIVVHSDVAAVQTVTDSWRYNGATVWNMGREATRDFSLWYYDDTGAYQGVFVLKRDGGLIAPGYVTAPTFNGALNGNAATATKLAGARTIDGQAFDGSANIELGRNAGSLTQDPNTTTQHQILTLSANCPDGSNYYHITTTFYGVSEGNWAQIAVQYDGGGKTFSRSKYLGTIQPWVRCDNGVGSTVDRLQWKNFGAGHTIFDASASLTPIGTACSNTDPAQLWAAPYPTLMGWNGSTTYGVRVDRARLADKLLQSAMVGTVAGTAAAPTGALMEYGSNANGEFWKYACGMIVVTGTFTGYSAGVSKIVPLPALVYNSSGYAPVSHNIVPHSNWDSSGQIYSDGQQVVFYSPIAGGINQVMFTVTGRWN
jgi:hypothetical protein